MGGGGGRRVNRYHCFPIKSFVLGLRGVLLLATGKVLVPITTEMLCDERNAVIINPEQTFLTT